MSFPNMLSPFVTPPSSPLEKNRLEFDECSSCSFVSQPDVGLEHQKEGIKEFLNYNYGAAFLHFQDSLAFRDDLCSKILLSLAQMGMGKVEEAIRLAEDALKIFCEKKDFLFPGFMDSRKELLIQIEQMELSHVMTLSEESFSPLLSSTIKLYQGITYLKLKNYGKANEIFTTLMNKEKTSLGDKLFFILFSDLSSAALGSVESAYRLWDEALKPMVSLINQKSEDEYPF